MVHLLPSTFIYFFLFFFQCKYADLVNGLADQGVFQRGRVQGGQGGGGGGQGAGSSSGVQSAAGEVGKWTLLIGTFITLSKVIGMFFSILALYFVFFIYFTILVIIFFIYFIRPCNG